MRLSELQVGDKAEVTGLKVDAAVRRRIMDMGLIKGTRFKVLRVAPLGDPVEIFFKGLYLTMRISEAEGIMVERIGGVGDGMPMQSGGRRRHGSGGAK
ncbi:FeoA family protein [Pelodictyon luteolum]|uniref:Ferrous iron transport protein A n=1 Tax=Chlorobium luteolum (strain DSM 273 / BCRC 81028 / 2530) TaxID=319225 RepID=Q3B164_CHLL3|nr:FeoA family protein [Pelodictyon luteolum]ABB24917.1 ferrous iron transport protein A [Pelodictyon luteolum DSM 273]